MKLAFGLFLAVTVVAGCGPQPPKVILESPTDIPAEYNGRKLYHTPQAYIYARSEVAAGEADRWVGDVKKYIKRNYQRELEKGVVLVMDPSDPPVARTLEDAIILGRDPTFMVTKPRHARTVAEVRKHMATEGIPEGPSVKGSSIALPKHKSQEMRLPSAAWAVAAPSHDLAIECGIEVGASALRKKQPDWSEEKARKAANMVKGTLAKAFEITRGSSVFITWAQRQSDWSDDQRREAILKYLRHTFTSNWLPAPSDKDLEW